MALNVYETLLILDSNKYARDPGGVASALSDLIAGIDGEVLASRLWMEQRLAYPMDGHQKGTYWLLYFRAEGKRLTDLDRALHLHEGVIRQMTLRIDPRLVEPMLANARGEYRQEDAEGEDKPEETADAEAATTAS
ncbi:30S ribosomal protein S6 [Roseimaritima multifibrata]|uniref:Small ribosomal subunit protein bS6 n=1 Tax=Roseimaritima multifibrata TaxID=1930274 RepID=A0A517MCQ9_9BACT|nr:30S ribosomal protein S6 [Roseimaritima multifibrata]QDS92679.1 30S ribosomal protein S6 [Roseimaritima multifibrata]